MVWQAYDSIGRPTRGQRDNLPANTFPAAICTGNDSFTILY